MKSLCYLFSMALFGFYSLEAAAHNYKVVGNCGGLPRIDVSTPAGLCVGLVADGFRFPRTLVEYARDKFVVVDMGGWAPKSGAVWRLEKLANGSYKKSLIFDKVDRPHGSAMGPDGKIYIGVIHSVIRFDPLASHPTSTLETVVSNLPVDGRHPLTAIVFDKQGNLYVNRGSASDNCEKAEGVLPDPKAPCPETQGAAPRGVIRRYELAGADRRALPFTNYAAGLRNSMAMAIHPQTGVFVQGENARDSIDLVDPSINDVEQPKEEINIIEKGGHYGWPYCYNAASPSPEYPNANCSQYRQPTIILPSHVAPLGMAYYTGSLLPSWYKNALFVTYHGYREYGQKLVALQTNAAGVPVGEPFEIINNWSKKGTQPLGNPVGVTVASDGSLYIVEDKNGDVLRVFYDAREGNGIPKPGLTSSGGSVDSQIAARCVDMASRSDLFTAVQREVIDPLCTSCHGGGVGNAGNIRLAKCDDIGNAERLLVPRAGMKNAFVLSHNFGNSELYKRLEGKTPGLPPMPSGGVAPEKLALVKRWIESGAPLPGRDVRGPGSATTVNITKLKRRPFASGDLLPAELCIVAAGTSLDYKERVVFGEGHVRLRLEQPFAGCVSLGREVFVFEKHFQFKDGIR